MLSSLFFFPLVSVTGSYTEDVCLIVPSQTETSHMLNRLATSMS